MKQRTFFIGFILLGLVLNPLPAAAYHRHHHTPHTPHHWAGVDNSAGYADIVIDADTGRIIHETDPDGLRHPASLTKMMTLYLTFQALEAGRLSLDQELPVSENAAYQSPTKLGLRPGQHIRVEDAILGLVTESANDAAVVLGEALGGSEQGFAHLMVLQARALGMTRTVFRNPSGLPDPEQVTTAHDMVLLGDALIHHYPEFYPYFDRDGYVYAGIYRHNHNHLKERYQGMDGIKTGYIRASGFNLVASARRGGIRLIGVVFGGRSAVARDNRMAQLLDASFTEAEADNRTGTVENAQGQGDAADADDSDYVALPAKIAAVFPLRAPAPPPSPVAASAPASTATPAAAPQPVVAVHAAVTVVQPAPAGAAANLWGIQIGAYSDPAIGNQALASLVAQMPDQLGKALPQVQPVSIGGAAVYRARLMALDKTTAEGVCSYLIQSGKSCLTVGP